MKRILLLAAAALVLSLLAPGGAWAFGTKDVVQMHRDGIADSLIIQKIHYSGKTFHLEASDIRALKGAGVSDEIISAMLATEERYDRDYGYYYPYYPRVVVGFGYYGYHGYPGYYSPFYGRPWPVRRFYSGYYGHPGFGRGGFAHPGYRGFGRH
jgi:hypothetical protein